MEHTLKQKMEQLHAHLSHLGSVAVAFSSGVDSTFLLDVAHEVLGAKAVAFTAASPFVPQRDVDEAAAFCREKGIEHVVVPFDTLAIPGVAENPKDRCYLCKKMLFQKLLDLAEELEVPSVADGTNADDLTVFRPGLRALAELGIKSPLAEAGFTKAEVRALAGKRELSVSGRPSAPCLATRFPYDTHLTKEGLRAVEEGEALLGKYISGNIRLRVHNNTARIEADPDQFPTLIKHHEDITGALRKLGFRYVTLDLAGFRSGSYDT